MFDGDQMGIYLPLTEAAQKEAKEKMLMTQNMWGPFGNNLSLEFKNDSAYGVYLLTMDPQPDSKVKAKCATMEELHILLRKYSDPSILVDFNGKINTIGRNMMEAIVEIPIVKQYKKKDVNKLFLDLLEKYKDHEKIMYQMNDLMKIAMIIPTIIGKSMDFKQFDLPEHLKEQKEAAFKAENPSEALSKLTKDTLDALKESKSIIYDLVNSGGRGKNENIQTQIVAKGYVEDTDGSVIDKPVKSSLSDGLTSTEYVDSSIGGRKGIIDRSQMTAISGYLTRQMVYCGASVKASLRVKDCGTKRFFEVDVTDKKIAEGLNHRYLSNGKLIENVDDILNKKISVRSPLYCTSPEICQTCLGYDVPTRIRASNIGIIAAQILGERGTQLTMQTFHTGGAGSIKSFLTEDSRLADIFIQDGNDITCKVPLQLIFEEVYIRGRDSNEYVVEVFKIKTEKEEIDFALSYNFTILIPDKDLLIIEDELYTVTYEANMICASMKNSSQSITGAIAEIMKIFNSRMFVNDALASKIHQLYSTATSIPLWAIEIIASQCARDPDKLQLPYRLSGMRKEPLRVPMKQVALLENWKRGAAFENVSNAFHQAVLGDSDKNMISSDLDNLLDL